MNVLKSWTRIPDNLLGHFIIIFPIIISQTIQRLYPMIDNRYVGMLGANALYLHNVQYNFSSLGQFIGLATYISCLIFWRRENLKNCQGSILIKHLILAVAFTSFLGIVAIIFTSKLINFYHIDSSLSQISRQYLYIGVANMILLAAYGGLDGMLVGSGKQRWSMYIAIFITLSNLVIDRTIIGYAGNPYTGSYNIIIAMKWIGLSTLFLISMALMISFIVVSRDVKGWIGFCYAELTPVWLGELTTYLLRGVVPFILCYQLYFVKSNSLILNTYQLGLHLSYIFCFPLIAALHVAVRDASKEYQNESAIHADIKKPPRWWANFMYTGLIPSCLLILVGALIPSELMLLFYNYVVPVDHVAFLSIFYLSCLIGQIGNSFSISLRAVKKNYLITKNFLIAELIVMVGGTQLLIYTNKASPIALGFVMVAFTFSYTIANGVSVVTMNEKNIKGARYVKDC